MFKPLMLVTLAAAVLPRSAPAQEQQQSQQRVTFDTAPYVLGQFR